MVERKPIASVVPIRSGQSGPHIDNTPPTGGGSAHALPPISRGSARERRADRIMRIPVVDRNRVAEEMVENIDNISQIRFLQATRDDICARFLRGVSEYEITRVLGGRARNVARIDVEAVIRDAYRADRARLLDLERAIRMAAA